MTRLVRIQRSLALASVALAAVALAACSGTEGGTIADSAAGSAQLAGGPSSASAPGPAPLTDAEREFYLDMASRSLAYLNTHYQDETGFVNATPAWANTTMWDVGGQLLAYHAARQLGLVDSADYDRRTRRTLATLRRVPLAEGIALSKLYGTKTGTLNPAGRVGWSATDLGRLFVALKVLAVREPQFAAEIEPIVRRNDFKRIVKSGYLHGALIGSKGKLVHFQEGRIGYEQYVAAGFDHWGAKVAKALSVRENARDVRVMGVPLLADKRYQDRLLSEPFILQGIELGLTGPMLDLARNVLALQQARFDSTGTITMVSEDAVDVAPEYFYYYCAYCDSKPFIVQGASNSKALANPRWVSTKAAFGWHVLMPSPYTKQATDYVAKALSAERGYASGVYEQTGKSTDTHDVNTAAVLLEIAYYRLRGNRPLIDP